MQISWKFSRASRLTLRRLELFARRRVEYMAQTLRAPLFVSAEFFRSKFKTLILSAIIYFFSSNDLARILLADKIERYISFIFSAPGRPFCVIISVAPPRRQNHLIFLVKFKQYLHILENVFAFISFFFFFCLFCSSVFFHITNGISGRRQQKSSKPCFLSPRHSRSLSSLRDFKIPSAF